MKKIGDITIVTSVPKTTITRGTVPEIRSETEYFVSLDHFFPFYPSPIPPNPENQNFESMIKAFGDVNILTSRNKKHDHMVYDYSDMECGRHFFVILGHILLFYSTTDPEN